MKKTITYESSSEEVAGVRVWVRQEEDQAMVVIIRTNDGGISGAIEITKNQLDEIYLLVNNLK